MCFNVVYLLVHVDVSTYVKICMHVCEGQRSTLGVFLNCSSLVFLEQDHSLNLELTDWLGWLASELQGSTSLCSHS